MTTQRFALSRYGCSQFEVQDMAATPFTRKHEVLPPTTLANAQSYTAYLNQCEAQGIAPLVFEDWWMEQPLPGSDEEESE